MRGSSHLAIGLITGVAVAGLAPGIPFSLAGIALAGFSSLAPDLDHPESRLSKRLGFTQHYVRWAFVAGRWPWRLSPICNCGPAPSSASITRRRWRLG